MARALAALPPRPTLSPEALTEVRERTVAENLTPTEAIGDRDLCWSERSVRPGLVVGILRPRVLAPGAPGFYNIHGGGMVMDNRYADLPRMVELVAEFGFVAVSVEYRLAPEHPHPAPVEDCYAGLAWMASRADELGFDRHKLVIGGGSAGGGLAAAVALLARDRGGPPLAGQLLLCPMLDDRNTDERDTADRVWSRADNAFGWGALSNGHPPSEYAAPARARDLTGLPPAFIEVGSAEIFRDEDVAYCARLWAAGVPAELHVWADAYHGFDRIAPASETARAALAARSSWIRRILGRS